MNKRGLAVALPVIALISACGGGGEDVAASEGEISSPIAEYLGYDAAELNDPEAAQAQFVEDERVRQDAIAACMKEQGFEYIAVDPSTFMDFSGPSEEFEYGSDEWVAKYGFGVTTQRWPQSSLGDGLVGYDDTAFSTEDQPVDPNMDIREGLSPEEQTAYDTALYGDQSGFEIDETLSEEEQQAAMEEMTFEMGGCYGEAQSEDPSTAFYEEFQTELSDMYERAQNDPRIVEFEKKIADCVSEKGMEYPGQEEIYSLWEPELAEIDSQITQPGADLTEEDYAAMSEEELTELFNQPIVFPEDAKAKLAELQKEEIALAQAVNDCGGSNEEQTRIFQEVITEYEQQFLDDNADRLEDLKSA